VSVATSRDYKSETCPHLLWNKRRDVVGCTEIEQRIKQEIEKQQQFLIHYHSSRRIVEHPLKPGERDRSMKIDIFTQLQEND
jgi:hypothetical protein